jgi:hypothetical protein
MILLSQDEFMKSDGSLGCFLLLKMADLPGDVAQRLNLKLSTDVIPEEVWFRKMMLTFFNFYWQSTSTFCLFAVLLSVLRFVCCLELRN